MSTELRDEINKLHANICNGLADPCRIMILYKLAESPSNVTELTTALETPQPTISRHLKVLRERNMVKTERAGQAVIYSLVDRRIITALDLLRAVLAESFRNQIALAKTVNESLVVSAKS